MSNPMSILIKDAMHRRRIERTMVGAGVGLSPTMISNITSGNYVLPCERVEGFAEVLNVPIRDLLAAGVASYPENAGWRVVEMMMRIRPAA